VTEGRPLLVVDAANVVGGIPDGWWRRRAEATELLRDALEPVAEAGLAGPGVPAWLSEVPLEVVLVVEGAASRVPGGEAVRVVPAHGSGDDAIVRVVAGAAGRRVAVATRDRGLRERVSALGAVPVAPGVLPRRARLVAR
jgi:hypothetical protein